MREHDSTDAGGQIEHPISTTQTNASLDRNEPIASPQSLGGAPLLQKKMMWRVQRKAAGAGPGDDVSVAQQGFSGGRSSVPYQSEMEAGFGRSFSNVEVYTGGPARQASEALGAEAYTYGNRVAFKSESPRKEVVAHELAHTIQQSGGSAVQTFTSGSENHLEAEADQAAATVVSGGRAEIALTTGGASSIQRWAGEEHYAMGNLGGQKAMAMVDISEAGVETKDVPKGHAKDGKEAGGVMKPDGKNVVEGGGQTVAVPTGKETSVTYGEASRFSGDYIEKPEDIAGRKDEGGDVGYTGSKVLGKVYAPLGSWSTVVAATNANHFYPLNRTEYEGHHGRALDAARKGDKETALREEGFAGHFLEDCFASGHMAPRSLDSIPHMMNKPKEEEPKKEEPKPVEQKPPENQGWFGKVKSTVGSGLSTAWEGAKWAGNKAYETGAAAVDKTVKGYQFVGDAVGGAMTCRTYHDFFCMLPTGLPTSMGRFHGDHLMDGNDLGVVSDQVAKSLAQVMAALPGAKIVGKADFGVQIPTPKIDEILADPVAGPAWKAMQGEYKGAFDKAKTTIKDGDKGVTSGGTEFDSKAVLDQIEANVMADGTGPKRPAELKAARGQTFQMLETMLHYMEGPWGANPKLGVNDDLAPSKGEKEHMLDPLEKSFGLFTELEAQAKAYLAATPEGDERTFATGLAAKATEWKNKMGEKVVEMRTVYTEEGPMEVPHRLSVKEVKDGVREELRAAVGNAAAYKDRA